MEIEFKDEELTNPVLKEIVDKDTELKEWLVDYVGKQSDPDNEEVTVEMIVQALGEEYPELIWAIAEENFFRGYEQALADVRSADGMPTHQEEFVDKLNNYLENT